MSVKLEIKLGAITAKGLDAGRFQFMVAGQNLNILQPAIYITDGDFLNMMTDERTEMARLQNMGVLYVTNGGSPIAATDTLTQVACDTF